MAKKFYKKKIVVEIISDERHDFDTLADVEYEITEGGSSGTWSGKPWQELTRKQAERALKRQGTDPSFLLGNDEEVEE